MIQRVDALQTTPYENKTLPTISHHFSPPPPREVKGVYIASMPNNRKQLDKPICNCWVCRDILQESTI